jgi:sulfhydrogenase subunit alpha
VQQAAREAGLGPVCRNPYQGIVVRALEVLYACIEARRIVAHYEPPSQPAVALPAPRAAAGHGATAAPTMAEAERARSR